MQERLQEIPTSTNRVSNGSFYEGGMEPFNALPGSEFDHPPHPSSQVLVFITLFGFSFCGDDWNNIVIISECQGSEFLQGFRSSGQDAFASAWDEVQNPQVPLFQGRNSLTNISPDQTQFQPQLNGTIIHHIFFSVIFYNVKKNYAMFVKSVSLTITKNTNYLYRLHRLGRYSNF